MKLMAPLRCALILCAPWAAAAEARSVASVTPIAKVLDLLRELAAKGAAEKEAEAVKFAAFSQWCDDQVRTKTGEVAAGSARIEQLQASIEKSEATIRELSGRIEELTEDVGRWTRDQQAAAGVRGKEAADYRATSQDYSESIDALAGAVRVLRQQAVDRPQAPALVQLRRLRRLRLVPEEAKRALSAYLQQDPASAALPDDRLFRKAPEAYGYEFQSRGLIELLAKLEADFQTKKRELDAEELSAQHAFEQVAQQLTDLVENANHEVSKKEALRAETQQAKSEAEGSLAQATADRAEDQKYLDGTQGLCAAKRQDFASRQKLREDELKAIQQATDVISSSSVAGAAEKHLPSLAQSGRRRPALAQLRSGLRRSPVETRLAAFLASRSQQIGSRTLSLVAEEVAAGPFDKVKQLIQDLIFKLMEEATAEQEHKGWCDAELAANKQTRDAKTEAVNKLRAEAEGLAADIAQLAQDIAQLSAAIKELDDAMAQATAERTADKAKNEQTVQEAKEAQEAVGQAIAVLKDFYASSAQATALVQQGLQQGPEADAPETFSGPYRGMLPESGGVGGFLEVILSDFSRLELDTAASEAAEQDQFERYMFESQKDKALKQNEQTNKERTKVDKTSALHATETELKATQEQLDAADAYYQKLKPSCVDSGISYEDRVKRRVEEIQSLQEALQILQGTDVDLS